VYSFELGLPPQAPLRGKGESLPAHGEAPLY
jgi:hypothetical protein